jgi:hypothetical protein
MFSRKIIEPINVLETQAKLESCALAGKGVRLKGPELIDFVQHVKFLGGEVTRLRLQCNLLQQDLHIKKQHY